MTEILTTYQKELTLRGFSESSCKNYAGSLKQFLSFCNKKPDEINKDNIRDYLYHLLTEKELSNSSVRISYSAIKYFFCQTLQKPWEMKLIPQIKKQHKLPSVFSFKEVSELIRSAANLKHKTLLMLIYSSGLRVGESSRLKIHDIIRDKMRLLIREAKGAKDRYALLSKICLNYLEKYWRLYRPANWLFPGRNQNEHISIRACQHAFALAKKNAGIKKPGGIHTLRHSFATHFLEIGGGIFQLQKFLGHKNLKTTLVYVHLQEEKIQAKNPLDVYGNENDYK